jgi:hypothetical protein
MKVNRAVIAVVDACMEIPGVKTAVKILAPTFTVRATRRFKPSKKDTRPEIILTMGEPNYQETEFIKKCKAAGEPFPVKKVQLKYYPEKKK